jgi:hypothetical protein
VQAKLRAKRPLRKLSKASSKRGRTPPSSVNDATEEAAGATGNLFHFANIVSLATVTAPQCAEECGTVIHKPFTFRRCDSQRWSLATNFCGCLSDCSNGRVLESDR